MVSMPIISLGINVGRKAPITEPQMNKVKFQCPDAGYLISLTHCTKLPSGFDFGFRSDLEKIPVAVTASLRT
jgi:hypothetical protein